MAIAVPFETQTAMAQLRKERSDRRNTQRVLAAGNIGTAIGVYDTGTRITITCNDGQRNSRGMPLVSYELDLTTDELLAIVGRVATVTGVFGGVPDDIVEFGYRLSQPFKKNAL